MCVCVIKLPKHVPDVLFLCLFTFYIKDMVMLQSALRGHLVRESQLKELLKETHQKVSPITANTSMCNHVTPQKQSDFLSTLISVEEKMMKKMYKHLYK